jgi:hypothetical protein
LCQQSPDLSICKTSAYGSSGCTAPPSCDGDAIQCGIATQSWKTACALDTSTALSETGVYDAAKAITGDQTTGLAGNVGFTFSGSSFDQTAHFGSAGLSDLSVTVMGHPITLQLSLLNQWLGYLGNLAVAVTLIVAMRISLGGNLNA